MCGLAGIISAKLDRRTREDAVARMVHRQKHRGPDDRGCHDQGPATLGMCRLAIIDPTHGHQPMFSPDERFSLIFNGTIYNYRELQAGLAARGWIFQTQSDTEVLLAAYALDGAACLSTLRGMFAFAIWDAREQTLFAARDSFGIKPLYYAQLPDGGLAFASELNALLASGQVPREIDPLSVSEYLAWFSVPAPRTIYRGITNLPPGHWLKVNAEGRCQTAAWDQLPASSGSAPIATNYHDFVHGLRHQLDDTIRAHRVADVPVGAFLSGGLDSTAIVGLMVKSGATQLKTFSLIFNEAEFSEQTSARLAATAFGTEHHEALITGARVAADLPRILASFDQPTGDGINTYYASQMARQGGVTVALSGLGGDELFGGYPSFRDLPRLHRLLPAWRRVPRKLRAALINQLRARPNTRARKLADFLAHARDLHELASLQRRVLPETARLALLATLGLALALPLLPFAAAAIWLEDRGPIFFRQSRVGKNRRLFQIVKLRTMRVSPSGEAYTRVADQRITRVGRFLRNTRLDEVPQLWNVLTGEMSLIGPRAEWVRLVNDYEQQIPCYHFRHLVKPGITGWAQVSYHYGENVEDTLRKLEYDLYYIRYFSFVLDASIILKTIHLMLFGKGR